MAPTLGRTIKNDRIIQTQLFAYLTYQFIFNAKHLCYTCVSNGVFYCFDDNWPVKKLKYFTKLRGQYFFNSIFVELKFDFQALEKLGMSLIKYVGILYTSRLPFEKMALIMPDRRFDILKHVRFID